MKRRSIGIVFIICLSLVAFPMRLSSGKIFDKTAKKQLASYLDDICQWILARQQASQSGEIRSVTQDPFSVQGNLARVLMAGSELTKDNARYLEEALRWCDRLADRQQRVSTSKGNEGGYWPGSSGPGKLDLSETSLAAAALARGHAYADGSQRKSYQQALERYARFLLEGAQADASQQFSASPGWVITQGEDIGAIGFVYGEGKALIKPATAATAAGAAFFAELYGITRNQRYREVSVNALDWVLKNRKANGEIPSFFEGEESDTAPFTTITISAEAIQAASYLLEDPNLQKRLGTDLENTVRQMKRVHFTRWRF